MNKAVLYDADIKEEWKDIKGYEGLYQISSFGRVKRLPRVAGNKHKLFWCFLKLQKSRDRKVIGLWKGGKMKRYLVHRLVGKAFIENIDNKPQINHKDNNAGNNRVENLYWGTQKENCADKIIHGTHQTGEKNSFHKLKEIDVLEIRKLYSSGYYTYKELGELFKVDLSNIGLIVNRKHWKYLT